MYKYTPKIDFISNYSNLFNNDVEYEEDGFPPVIEVDYKYIIDLEMSNPEKSVLEGNKLIKDVLGKIVYYSYKSKYNKYYDIMQYGVAFNGECHEVDDNIWMQENNDGNCYIANGEILLEYLKYILLPSDIVSIVVDECPIYIYNKYFMVVCRCFDVYKVINNKKFYRVAIFNTLDMDKKECYSIEGKFWSLMGNVDNMCLLNKYKINIIDEENIINSVRELIEKYFDFFDMTNQSCHCIQLINILISMMQNIRCIDWLSRIGFFIIMDDILGVVDNRCICLWNPYIFAKYFNNIAKRQFWMLSNMDNPHMAELNMPGLCIKTINYVDKNIVEKDGVKYYWCRIKIENMLY